MVKPDRMRMFIYRHTMNQYSTTVCDEQPHPDDKCPDLIASPPSPEIHLSDVFREAVMIHDSPAARRPRFYEIFGLVS